MTDTEALDAPAKRVCHIVLWNVAGETPGAREAAIAKIKGEFEGLRGRIPGLLSLEVGVDVSRISYACDVALVSVFDSEQSLKDYATHPEHLKVRDALDGVRIARHQVDYLISG